MPAGPASAAEPVVQLNHVRFSYDDGASWALDDVTLTVCAGERVCLTGANGSGKSTLARLIAGLTAPDEGAVTLFGYPVFTPDGGADADGYRAARRLTGAVFQNPGDQIVTTVVEDDVAFGPENLAVPAPDISKRVTQTLQTLEMDAHRSDNPLHLSGGQQQRVAVAGMLAMRPRLLVLDEPTAMLDADGRRDVLAILDRLQADGMTIVHVTHHPDETAHATRIIRLDHGHLVPAAPRGCAFPADTPPADTSQADTPPADTSVTVRSHSPAPAPDATDAAAVLTVDQVSFRYPDAPRPTLTDVSLTVHEGEVVALTGPNGAGKSTLLRLLCALDRPADGRIRIGDVTLTSRKPARRQLRRLRTTTGLVMQQPERQLFASTVAQDVAYGPRQQGLPEARVRSRVHEALALLHIEHLADCSPFRLSGGQQRLAAIAGVIACHPRVLLLDEPTAGLDHAARSRILAVIRHLSAQGVAVVLITHDPADIAALGCRTVRLHPQQAAAPAVPARIPRPSPLQRVDPRVRMVATLAAMCSAFAITNGWQLLLAAAITGAVIAASRLNLRRLCASVRALLAVVVCIGLLNVVVVRSGIPLVHWGWFTLTDAGVRVAVLYACRFALVILLGAVFLLTITPTAMTDAFASLLSPLHRCGVHVQELALVLSLALRFLPTLTGEVRTVRDAQAVRGGSLETGSLPQRIRALSAVVVPVLAGTVRHADGLGLALDARCYEAGAPRTHWHALAFRRRDGVVLLATGAYIAGIVALGV